MLIVLGVLPVTPGCNHRLGDRQSVHVVDRHEDTTRITPIDLPPAPDDVIIRPKYSTYVAQGIRHTGL